MEQKTACEKLPIGTIVRALDEVRHSNEGAPDTVVRAGTYGRIYENNFQGEAHFEYGVHWFPVTGLVGIEVNPHEFEVVPPPKLWTPPKDIPELGSILRAKRLLIGADIPIPAGTYGILQGYACGCDDGFPYMVHWLLADRGLVPAGAYEECFEVV